MESFALLKTYPNPFNPITTFSFMLERSGDVNLTIFDLQGKRVTNLINGWRTEGEHEVSWDASGFASGIYIYRLKAGEFVASGKIVLLK
ncbi:MAG: T9SS type A sorting domain-containing protein [bacterium]